MNKTDLDAIVEANRKYNANEPGGTWANLRGADLSGAKGIIAIYPCGSREDMLIAVAPLDAATHEIMVGTGCFWDTITVFEQAVAATHGDNRYAQEYHAIIALVRIALVEPEPAA